MPFPDNVAELVERFERNREAYRSDQYNEAQLRQEFINPFFAALGWDMDNKAGYAQAYKDVVHEDSLKISGGTKAPDYCFRIGGARKFFVEAKKPAVNLRDDPSPAFQLRRYAWSAKLPLSILTDFEECAVYDCRVKPASADKAAAARISYLTYKDYAAKWDEIAAVFSRDAILKGAFDKYAESTSGRRGTAEVDDAFLRDIESWRDSLAHNLALRNPGLSQRELNFAVQRTIDRIIFLRICEDRGIESYAGLRVLLNGARVYPRLTEMFRAADDRYNSGLFHFGAEKGRPETPDELTLSLAIDDKPLKDIIRNLYYPDSPYEFSVLPADILGQVYEQFLGKVIRLTPGHQAKVEDKPEVKKAGGVYYTPTYIVDYIVANTVGKLVEGKTPKQVEKLRILDPACGSGSFLIGAYQFLLDWHRDWYVADSPQKWAKGSSARIYDAGGSDWRLINGERKRILLNNIYGVDIDSQAVEVTKLSLLLKIIEGGAQLALAGARMLPDLGGNIKCGNSLIGPNFYAGQQMTLLDEEERYRVNVFDWNAEFSEVMKAGGFDAVIGNPPYVRSQSLGQAQRQYYSRSFRSATATYDIYVLFVERALRLMSNQGRAGFILPNKFFTTDYGEGLRAILTDEKCLDALVDFEDGQVFQRAGTYTTLIFLSRKPIESPRYASLGQVWRAEGTPGLSQRLGTDCVEFDPFQLPQPGIRWSVARGSGAQLLARLHRDFPALATLSPRIFQGLKTSADKVYLVRTGEREGPLCTAVNGLSETVLMESGILRPVVKGEHVHRYRIDASQSLHIVYPYRVDERGRAHLMSMSEINTGFPNTAAYLGDHRATLGARDGGKWAKREDWYAYARGQNIGAFDGEKFLIPYMSTRLRAAYDPNRLFFVNITTGGYGLRICTEPHSENYILGLLNSVLLDHCTKQMTNRFRGGYFAINKQALERLPIRLINFSDPADKARHDRMVALVDQILSLHKQLAEARLDDQKTAIQRQIDFTDRQIDLLVYELYGLDESEIAIVESAQV